MTTTSPIITGSPTPTESDVRTVFARAMATGGDVIAGVRPDQLDGPTPCPDYDVRLLIAHLVAVLERVALMGRGENPFQAPDKVVGLADDAWLAAWSDAAQRVEEGWADDASLIRTVRLPWAEESGALTLASYTNEITVHTWDLAKATGQHPAWDAEVVETAWQAARGMPGDGRAEMFAAVKAGMPEPYRSAPDPWAAPVPVPDDAPLVDRLVAWNGRRP
ncbi:MAG TPA: TIGR03086 family metal-binding protein [Acidimicrobiales bacterium]|nr:TIGR03086 family metal-binding protein [Acidimicrobiales bacterium]